MNSLEIMQVLPKEIKEDVKNTLRAYEEVFIVFENGKYHFGTCIKSHYANDHKVLGTVYARDIYTELERVENYINAFWDYPTTYKGKRDYTILKKMKEERTFETIDNKLKITQYIGKINEHGDFEITGTETSII